MADKATEGSDEVNARFDELIAGEFGSDWIPTLDDEPVTFDPHEPASTERPSFQAEPEPANEASELVEDSEDDEFEVPPLEPMRPPSSVTIVLGLAFAYSVGVGMALAFGVALPSLMSWSALIAFVGSLAGAFLRLPMERGPRDGDGAVV